MAYQRRQMEISFQRQGHLAARRRHRAGTHIWIHASLALPLHDVGWPACKPAHGLLRTADRSDIREQRHCAGGRIPGALWLMESGARGGESVAIQDQEWLLRWRDHPAILFGGIDGGSRSEERRLGKECR